MNHKQFSGLQITVQPEGEVFEVVFWSPLGERTVTIESTGGVPCEELEDILCGINNAPEMAGILDVDVDEIDDILASKRIASWHPSDINYMYIV